MAGYQGTILESTIQTYFDYGSSRIEMISQLIDIDINSKKLRIQKENQLENVANLEKSLEELGTNEYVIEQRLLFKSNLIQVFRNTEADALENIFHLAAALKFVTLWDFDMFHLYSSLLGDTESTSNIYLFNGYQPIKDLSKQLAEQKCIYKKCITRRYHRQSPKAWMWEFDKSSHPEMFKQLEDQEVVKFNITGRRICGESYTQCYNARLLKIVGMDSLLERSANSKCISKIGGYAKDGGSEEVYVELLGQDQDDSIKEIKMILVRMGDNKFYLPNNKHIVLEQRKMEKRLVTMPVGNSVAPSCQDETTCEATSLTTNFARWAQICSTHPSQNNDDLFGAIPCRSPFGDYLLEVPIKKGFSSLHKNGEKLDLSKVNKIKFYALLEHWLDYPTDKENCSSIRCSTGELGIKFPGENNE